MGIAINPRSLFAVILIVVIFSASAGRTQPAPNYLSDAKIGEWVLYELEGGTRQKSTVVHVDQKWVKLKNETILSGKIVKVVEEKMLIADGLAMYTGKNSAGLRSSQANAVVNGAPIPCQMIETRMGTMVIRIYISNLIPVMGLIKMETKAAAGDPLVRLIDYGFSQ